MRRTLTILATTALVSAVYGLQAQERQQRMDSDDALRMTYVVTIDGKFAAQGRPPQPKNPPGAQTQPSQIKVLLPSATTAGKGGGEVAMEEITLMSDDFKDWIKFSIGPERLRKDMTVSLFSPEGKPLRAAEFTSAYVSEISFPSLDANSKDPAYMSIKIACDEVKYVKGDGGKVEGKIAPATKKWQASNFKIEIGDLPCDRVSKVDSITWKQAVVKDEVGSFREAKTEQTRTGIENIKITLPMSDWDSWENWMTSSLLSKTELKDASITVLGPDRTDGYSINFHDVSIVAMSLSDTGQNIEDVRTFEVELHYNETEFNFVSR